MYNQADRCSSCTRTLAMMVNMPHVIKCAHERDIFLIASHSCFDPEFQCETSKRNNCMSSYSPAVQSVEVRTSLVSHAKKTVNDVSTSISAAAFTQDAHAHHHQLLPRAQYMPHSITHTSPNNNVSTAPKPASRSSIREPQLMQIERELASSQPMDFSKALPQRGQRSRISICSITVCLTRQAATALCRVAASRESR